MTSLEAGGACAKAGMLPGSALLSVSGIPIKSHQHAIQLLEREAHATEEMSFRFEVVVREGRQKQARPVVQSL